MERERLNEGGVEGRRLMAKRRKVERAVGEAGRDRRESAVPRPESKCSLTTSPSVYFHAQHANNPPGECTLGYASNST